MHVQRATIIQPLTAPLTARQPAQQQFCFASKATSRKPAGKGTKKRVPKPRVDAETGHDRTAAQETLDSLNGGFTAAQRTQVRKYLPALGQTSSTEALDYCVKLLHGIDQQNTLQAANITAMHVMRIVTQAEWLVYNAQTEDGALLMFSDRKAVERFSADLPTDGFEHVPAREIGAALMENEDTFKAIVMNPTDPENVEATFYLENLTFFVLWSEIMFFEEFLKLTDMDNEVALDDQSYNLGSIWERTYVIGILGTEEAKEEKDLSLLADPSGNIAIFTGADHVAESVVSGGVYPETLSGKELLELLERYEAGCAFMVGGDIGPHDAVEAQHHTVVWTYERAKEILSHCKTLSEQDAERKGQEGGEEKK